MKKIILILMAAALICIMPLAKAAAEWFPSADKYYKYDTTPLKADKLKVYKHLVTTDTTSVRAAWVKLPGTYVQYTTVNGGLKYAIEEIIIPPPPVTDCEAEFVSNESFGWVYNLNMNTVLKCPQVKIIADQPHIFEGLVVVNGVATCK